MISINLKTVPFSRYGSYMMFGYERKDKTFLNLRSIAAPWSKKMFTVHLIKDGNIVEHTETATPTMLTLKGGDGSVDICISEPNVIRVRGKGVGIRFAYKDEHGGMFSMYLKDGLYMVNNSEANAKYLFNAVAGKMNVTTKWMIQRSGDTNIDFVPDAKGEFEGAVVDSLAENEAYQPSESFDTAHKKLVKEYQSFVDKLLKCDDKYSEVRELSGYIMWSCVVAPRGLFKRDAMLMSKNWMNQVWSWDHCFNAMALAKTHPDLAWDQFMVMFDQQNEYGQVPDLIGPQIIIWSFTKPPIHGWALKHILGPKPDKKKVKEVYGPLCKFTEWWLKYRDSDGDGMCDYHHGNDCGWDNCTSFDIAPPIEGVDLAAYLAIQMEVLSEYAAILGKKKDAEKWAMKGRDMIDRLFVHSWQKDQFVSLRSGDHVAFDADSLFNYLPIVLGKRLPKELRKPLIDGIVKPGRFLTDNGFATENVSGKYYQSDGYWRGPIWAPSTMLIYDGLVGMGEKGLSKEVARKFCDMCNKSGLAENYDAVTGAGLRDTAYTWTSAVFLLLANSLKVSR